MRWVEVVKIPCWSSKEGVVEIVGPPGGQFRLEQPVAVHFAVRLFPATRDALADPTGPAPRPALGSAQAAPRTHRTAIAGRAPGRTAFPAGLATTAESSAAESTVIVGAVEDEEGSVEGGVGVWTHRRADAAGTA